MKRLFDFLDHSPTYFQTIEQSKSLLEKKGFKALFEDKDFKLKKGGKYYVARDNGALIAFIVPKKSIDKTISLLSHGDSPSFKIKPNGESKHENMVLWSLETYGGPTYSTWMNRNCGIAGRVFVENGGKLEEKVIEIDDHPIIISQLPIHIDRQVNKEGLKISPQEHLQAIATLSDKKFDKVSYLETLLKKKIKFQKLVSHELYLYPLEKARYLGDGKDLFSSARIDNLLSASASLEALEKVSTHTFNTCMPIVYIASHEEVGSKTYSGMDSSFFKSIFKRIFYQFDSSYDSLQKCLAKSMAYSLDGAHAMDPKFKEKFEPNHTPYVGRGVTIKLDANANYALSMPILAHVEMVAKKNKIPTQLAMKRGDQRQGSTIGPMFLEKMGIQTLDMGFSQLSMHAACEVGSCDDYGQLVKLLTILCKN